MLKNLFKQTLRGLARDRFNSLINIFGLGLGIACCIIGLLFVQSELGFDQSHARHERIFRYGVEMTIGGVTSIQSSCNPGAGPLLKDFIPEIESFARIGYLGEILLKDKDRAFSEENILWADPSLFNIFSHSFVYGNPKGALDRDNTMVLTRSLAMKIFGNKNPLGAVLEIENQGPFEITAVVADPPDNDQLQFFRPALLFHPVQGARPGAALSTVETVRGHGRRVVLSVRPGIHGHRFRPQGTAVLR